MMKLGRAGNHALDPDVLSRFDSVITQVNDCLKLQGHFDRLPRLLLF